MSEPYVIDAADIVFFDPNGTPYAASCLRDHTINDCIGELTELGPFTASPWGCEALCPEPLSGLPLFGVLFTMCLVGAAIGWWTGAAIWLWARA